MLYSRCPAQGARATLDPEMRSFARLAPLLGALVLSGLAGAQSSPASELFMAATREVGSNYYGWSKQNFAALQARYERVLKDRCAQAAQAQVQAQTRAESCDYATGRAVLEELLTAFGDDHTYVRDAEGAARLREIEQGLPVRRTGLRLSQVEGGLLVVQVIPGSPAESAGLQPFDLLTEVAGRPTAARATTPITAGQPAPLAAVGTREFVTLERRGQPLGIKFLRPGQVEKTPGGALVPRAVTLETALLPARDEPTLSWVGGRSDFALIRVGSFLAPDVAALFLDRVREAQRRGARGLIVDLRFNGGGSLTQCVAAASIFGPAVYNANYRVGGLTFAGLSGREARPRDVALASTDQRVWNGPAAVLIGPDTASCAEVFSFYARQRQVSLVGGLTKGVGNSGVVFRDLPDGGVLAVTVLRAYDAANRPLPARLAPDLPAPLDLPRLLTKGRDAGVEAAVARLEEQLGR